MLSKFILLMYLFSVPFNIYASEDGIYRVIDGDTITVGSEKIRLLGIDAPELNQKCYDKKSRGWPCGESAKSFLEGLMIGKSINCEIHSKDKYKRSLGVCYGDKINLNQEIVKAGYALAYLKYSSIFKEDELLARKNKKGIWKGNMENPENFRRRKSKTIN